ncbi:MAG: ABC transporter permease [Acidobacteria bacterium]|nr:ABC transporter permease [Acidobacteriota bacterium]
MLTGLMKDLQYTFRGLRRSPLFAATAIISLALGIGANAAIFSLLHQVLLQRLPVRDPQQLVLLDAPGPNHGMFNGDHVMSLPFYKQVRDENQVFSGVLAREPIYASFAAGNTTDRAYGEIVSGNYFEMLGVGAAQGRTIVPADDGAFGSGPVIVLGYGFWQRRFGGDPGIVGKSIELNAKPMTVIGVAAPKFEGFEAGRSSDFYVPISMATQLTQIDAMAAMNMGVNSPFNHWLNIFARLKPGLKREQAEAGINVLFHQIREAELKAMPHPSQGS